MVQRGTGRQPDQNRGCGGKARNIGVRPSTGFQRLPRAKGVTPKEKGTSQARDNDSSEEG